MVHSGDLYVASAGVVPPPSQPPPSPTPMLTFRASSGDSEMCNVELKREFLFPALPKFVAENDSIIGGSVSVGSASAEVVLGGGTAVVDGANGSALIVGSVGGVATHAMVAVHHHDHHQVIYHRHHHHHHHHHRLSSAALERRQHHAMPFTELGLPHITNNCTITFPVSTDFNKRGDAVHRNCVVCDTHVPMADLFTTKYNIDSHMRIQKLQTTALHVACTLPTGASWVKMLCANGAKVNEPNLEGQTPLHLVLLGDIRQHRKNTEECLATLLMSGADVNARDKEGDSPLLYVRTLLKEGLYEEAANVADVLLQHGADPNAVNAQGRTLLTYSVYHLDDGVALSRLLLNHGASVWPTDEPLSIEHSVNSPPSTASSSSSSSSSSTSSCSSSSSPTSCSSSSSPFGWFLKSVIALRRLENCSATVRLLSHAMGERPKRMHAHVLRTMFRHVRCFRVLGPVFLQLKLDMMRYWSEPQDLKYLCWRAVRRSVGARRVLAATPHLGLPRPLQRYMLME